MSDASMQDLQDNNVVTVVAVNKGKNSPLAVRWAIDNLMTNSKHTFILAHVKTRRRYLTFLSFYFFLVMSELSK